MSTIDLNACFPIGADGRRSPLPKQKQFLSALLSGDGGPKYVRYVGGIGSGKTLIGCIGMLHMAVLKSGDYLIARQYMPELKDTTYKTFMEICPPELIVESRIADMLVKIRTVGGGLSTIMFRGLEDADKLRSLNLNAFYIDEAAQVSEAAFLLLQGRLRGRAWRKGFVTQNPGGHDFLWRWFVKQDHISNPDIKRMFLNIRAPSLENIHLPDGYVDTLMATWSEQRIKREIMGSDDTFEGQVYSEFDRQVHVVRPFRIPDDWTIRVGIDHGYRNAAAWIYLAISPDGDCYIYDEFYQKEWLISEICKTGKDGSPSAHSKLAGRTLEQARIDPSVKAVRGTTGKSDWDTYLEHLPSGFPLFTANNEVNQGIDRVKSYLKPDKNGRPRLYIFETCVNLLDEMAQYRWQEHATAQQGKANDKEKPVKHNDHAVDAARYVLMTCPEATPKIVKEGSQFEYGTLEHSLFEDIRRAKHKKNVAGTFFSDT
jgi:phage terminase large subunit